MMFRTTMNVVLALAMCGCAHSLLYDQNRDEQGKAAVKAVQEAHTVTTVEGMNKAFADVAKREEDSARERAQQLFDWEIDRVARARTLNAELRDDNTDVDGLATSVRARLAQLGVSVTPSERAPIIEKQLAKDADSLAANLQSFKSEFGIDLKDCKTALARPGVQDQDAVAQFKTIVDTCNRINDSQYKLGRKSLLEEKLKNLRISERLLRTDTELLAKMRFGYLGRFGVRFATCQDIRKYLDPARSHLNRTPPNVPSYLPNDKLLEQVTARNPAELKDRREAAAAEYHDLYAKCESIGDSLKQRNETFGNGLITELSQVVEKSNRERAEYRAIAQEAQAKLEQAKKAIEPAQEDAATPPPSADRIQNAVDEVLQVIGHARELNELAGEQVVAEDTLERLEHLLGAIAGTGANETVKLSPDDQLTVKLVQDFAALRDEANKLATDAKKPRLVPFLAAIEYQKLVLEKVEAESKALDAQAEAQANQLQSLIDEAIALSRVLQPIESHDWGSRSIEELDNGLKGNDKAAFYAALGTYGDEVRQYRVNAEVWKSRALAAGYERDLISSKYAAQQWDSMMDMTAKVLADYHAAGIKPEDLMEFFKALGLVAIGVGVAQ